MDIFIHSIVFSKPSSKFIFSFHPKLLKDSELIE